MSRYSTGFMLLVAMFAMRCGGSSSPEGPSCGPGEFAVEGTIDGQAVSGRHSAPSNYSFINAFSGHQGTLDITNSGGVADHLHLEFSQLLSDGGSVNARGYVTLSASNIALGDCAAASSYPSSISINSNGSAGTFQLNALQGYPACSGATKSGSLLGCYASP